jgi:hypothetical protein
MRRKLMPIISIPKQLQERLVEESSEELMQVLNEQSKETRDSVLDTADLRFSKKLADEVSGLRSEISAVEQRLDNRITEAVAVLRQEIVRTTLSVRDDLKEENYSLREELKADITCVRKEIYKSKNDTIKWMGLQCYWMNYRSTNYDTYKKGDH